MKRPKLLDLARELSDCEHIAKAIVPKGTRKAYDTFDKDRLDIYISGRFKYQVTKVLNRDDIRVYSNSETRDDGTVKLSLMVKDTE